jgi:hypothetical protein
MFNNKRIKELEEQINRTREAITKLCPHENNYFKVDVTPLSGFKLYYKVCRVCGFKKHIHSLKEFYSQDLHQRTKDLDEKIMKDIEQRDILKEAARK